MTPREKHARIGATNVRIRRANASADVEIARAGLERVVGRLNEMLMRCSVPAPVDLVHGNQPSDHLAPGRPALSSSGGSLASGATTNGCSPVTDQ